MYASSCSPSAWRWVYGYYTETSSTTRRLTVRKSAHASTAVFYLDGAQVEAIAAGETVSTYIDGDQQGLVPNQYPPAFVWAGTPHASTSSRSGLTRAGGMVMRFSKYQLLVTALIGLGLAAPLNIATDYARLDGSFDDYTRKPVRTFSLAGRFQAQTYQQLRDLRGGLAQLLDRDLIGQDQRLILRHERVDARGSLASSASLIPAKYAGGLDGNTDNHYAEQVAIAFQQYLPVVLSEAEAGAALTVQQSVSNANYVLQRSASGVWSALGTGITGTQVNAIARATNGTVYVGGNFTDAGGSGADHIAQWNGSSWSTLASATALNSFVYDLAVAPSGTTIYVAGAFTNANANANADYLATWNGSAWGALGTGLDFTAQAVAVAPNGDVYVGGLFLNAGGTAANYIAKWNGSAWSAVGSSTALNAAVQTIAIDGTKVYVGGDFTNANGIANADYIAVWDTATSTWSALGTGMNGTVISLAVVEGYLYAVGSFTTSGGVTTNGFARWNGTAWESLNGASGILGGWHVAPDPQGKIIASSNSSTTFGGITMPDRIARWNGATWLPVDVDLPGAGTIVRDIFTAPDGVMYLGFDGTGTATAAATTTVTNTGTARAYPTLRITGPSSGTSRIYQIVNTTTGRSIYLNYTINAGETALLRFEPENLSFTSTFQGNIANTILPGSNQADFFLQPGANVIAFFAADSSVVAALSWRPAFVSLDDVP